MLYLSDQCFDLPEFESQDTSTECTLEVGQSLLSLFKSLVELSSGRPIIIGNPPSNRQFVANSFLRHV